MCGIVNIDIHTHIYTYIYMYITYMWGVIVMDFDCRYVYIYIIGSFVNVQMTYIYIQVCLTYKFDVYAGHVAWTCQVGTAVKDALGKKN